MRKISRFDSLRIITLREKSTRIRSKISYMFTLECVCMYKNTLLLIISCLTLPDLGLLPKIFRTHRFGPWCIHTYMHICVYIYIHTNIYAYIYICMCIIWFFLFVATKTILHTTFAIHTHTHRYTPFDSSLLPMFAWRTLALPPKVSYTQLLHPYLMYTYMYAYIPFDSSLLPLFSRPLFATCTGKCRQTFIEFIHQSLCRIVHSVFRFSAFLFPPLIINASRHPSNSYTKASLE